MMAETVAHSDDTDAIPHDPIALLPFLRHTKEKQNFNYHIGRGVNFPHGTFTMSIAFSSSLV